MHHLRNVTTRQVDAWHGKFPCREKRDFWLLGKLGCKFPTELKIKLEVVLCCNGKRAKLSRAQ